MIKLYIITYKTDMTFNPVLFHNYINTLFAKNWISDWWHYTDNTYIVASVQDVSALYRATFPGIPGKYILIIEVNPDNAQGWLPEAAWTWIKKYRSK